MHLPGSAFPGDLRVLTSSSSASEGTAHISLVTMAPAHQETHKLTDSKASADFVFGQGSHLVTRSCFQSPMLHRDSAAQDAPLSTCRVSAGLIAIPFVAGGYSGSLKHCSES